MSKAHDYREFWESIESCRIVSVLSLVFQFAKARNEMEIKPGQLWWNGNEVYEITRIEPDDYRSVKFVHSAPDHNPYRYKYKASYGECVPEALEFFQLMGEVRQ